MLALAITGTRPLKKPSSCGVSLPRAIRVEESCRIAGSSWISSGLVLSAKARSRRRVSLDSSRKVGKARKVASMSRLRCPVTWKTWLALRIRLLSWPWRAFSALKVTAPWRKSWRTARRWVSSTRKKRSNWVKVGSSSPERVGEGLAAAVDRERRVLHPGAEGGAGLRVEGAEDLVELHGLGDLGVGERAAVGDPGAVAAARGQLDVGLAEQRLGAQGRAGVGGQRRVGVVDVDRRQRVLAVGRERHVADFADRDAGDADVGLGDQRRRLVEGDLDLVGLGAERGRAAEGDPEEEQDAEARQREAGDHREAGGAGRLLVHGQACLSLMVGTLVACCRVCRNGRTLTAPSTRFAVLQESMIMLRRSAPEPLCSM